METDPKIRVILGLVTLLVLAGLGVWGAQWLKDDPGGRTYYVYFAESVAGLSRDSQVTYNGITVGKVGEIERVPRPDGIYARVELQVGEVDIYAGPLFLDGVPERPRGRSTDDPWFKEGDRLLFVGATPITTLESYQEALGAWDMTPDADSEVIFQVRRQEDAPSSDPAEIPIRSGDGAPLLRFGTQGTRAMLAANFVTGIKNVELVGGRAGLRLLEGNQIPAGRSQLARFFEEAGESLPELIASVQSTVDNVNALLGPESDLGATLANIRQLTHTEKEGQLAEVLAAIQTSFEKISAAADEATALLQPEGSVALTLDRIAHEVGPDGSLVPVLQELRTSLAPGGTINQAVGSVKKAFDQVQKSLAEGGNVAETLKGVQDALGDLRYHIRPDGPVAARLEELGYVMRTDLRQTLTRLSSALRTIEEKVREFTAANPSSWIMGTKGEK